MPLPEPPTEEKTLMGTKIEPGEYDCYGKATDDEPIFTLRANDTCAPALVRIWVGMQLRTNDFKTNKCLDALTIAEDMEKWKANND